MRKAFLKKMREKLLEMRAQLLRSTQSDLHEGREQTKDEGMDTYDIASDARDREISLILNDRDRDKMLAATRELLEQIVRLNRIDPADVASATFSVTPDLDAEFPAIAVRSLPDWDEVPLLCSREIPVPGPSRRSSGSPRQSVNISRSPAFIARIAGSNAAK